jgi:hypothetical protein
MNKQQIAQKRNYFKYVIVGIPKPIDLECLTGPEKFAWGQILAHRKTLLNEFEQNSRQKGLNVPEHRCWCGKPAKYINYGDPESTENPIYYTCKKHIEYE